MKVYRTTGGIIIENNGNCFLSGADDWDAYINRDDLYAALRSELENLPVAGDDSWLQSRQLLAPIGSQEVWAAGVTYLRSKVARMEESESTGGASFYDRVYEADRPELFFKALAHRVAGPGAKVRIRKDSVWDVPEPELTLLLASSGKIIGYTVGNDMSSRSIEGENPLYLPQAKTYDRSAALGPCILVLDEPIAANAFIYMTIDRDGKQVFEGRTTIDQMKRKHAELAGFLFRECSFPQGCFLMTGTCIVPGNDFTLRSGDLVRITIEHIGMLENEVE